LRKAAALFACGYVIHMNSEPGPDASPGGPARRSAAIRRRPPEARQGPRAYTTQDQWTRLFGGMDRRSLYAAASNQGGQFTTLEQQMAGSMMSQQLSQVLGGVGGGGSETDHAASFKGLTDFPQNVSPEEKQSIGWAMNMASAATSYNAFARDTGQPTQDASFANPLVKVLTEAMKAAQGDPSKDRRTAWPRSRASLGRRASNRRSTKPTR
jgi:hypothetical protein